MDARSRVGRLAGRRPAHYAHTSTSTTLDGRYEHEPHRSAILANPTFHAGGSLAHAARHDPARVLREVEAKRGIIEEHQIARNTVTAEGDFSNAPGCATCHESDGEVVAFGYCRTLRLLALPYADHEDFREEWRS